ncbi:unnamed protein product [Miscanthus lutarioriparius]|uniref:Uncharacterized protein n=1 Tax=Miscanthus lutarioriparius TaxID=422564 RepID=A0A811MXJ7_9POAL|nr:unnamed protein product [Miscanthus lutarioriparius]
MANDGSSPRTRGGGTGGRRWCGTLITRVDLLIFLLTAALCSASYCLAIWHNSRGAADSRVLLGPSAAGATHCGDDADKPLDFETHHAAEDAGLSVSSTAAAKTTTRTRRALRGGAADGSKVHRGVAWAEAGGGGSLRFTDAVA